MQTQILGLVTPLMALFFAATFVALWHFGRMKRHVLGFALAYAFSAIGFLITHLLPVDTLYVFHTTQLFYTLGVVAMIASVCERAGLKLHLGSMLFVYACSASVLAGTIVLSNDVSWRLTTVNTGYGVMFAMGVTTLLSARRRTAIDGLIIAVMALQAFDFLVRPTVTLLFESSIPAQAYRESLYYSFIGLALGVKGAIGAMVLIGASIVDWSTALRETNERDPLTGLHNRGSFEDSIAQDLNRAQSEGKPISLVVADIDHFKQVNDIWGHQAGDKVISEFGQLIARMVRGCDTAGRVGGEEFCIAVWDCENDPARRLAERIRIAFSEIQHADLNEDIRITASFGVATARDGETYRQLFARADEALYRAKFKSRDRVESAGDKHLVEVVCDKTTNPEPKRAAS
ncbi:MAG: GGDEF domain-containing protein [Pseudomonadota bacterium]